MNAKLIPGVLLAFALLAGVSGAENDAAENVPEFYTVTNTNGLIPFLQGVAGSNAMFHYNAGESRLMVVTTRDRQAQIKSWLAPSTPSAAMNILIKVRIAGVGNVSRSEERWRERMPRYEITGPTTMKIHGPVIIERGLTMSSDNSEQSILIANGGRGVLFMGDVVPLVESFEFAATQDGLIGTAQVAWRSIGARLAVEPLVEGVGPIIRLRITPELSGQVNGTSSVIRVTSIKTEVVARDGETVCLGGLAQNRRRTATEVLGTAGKDESTDVQIYLTPYIRRLGGGAAPADRIWRGGVNTTIIEGGAQRVRHASGLR